jgi:hypothetical protein
MRSDGPVVTLNRESIKHFCIDMRMLVVTQRQALLYTKEITVQRAVILLVIG